MITTVPVPSRAVPPSTTVVLQPLVQPPPGSEEGKKEAGWIDRLRELTATEALGCFGVDTGPHLTYSSLTSFSCSLAPVSPVVLIQGAIRVQPEGPAPPAPRPERKSIVPAPVSGNSCPPEVDVSTGEQRSRASNGDRRGKCVMGENCGVRREQKVRGQTFRWC